MRRLRFLLYGLLLLLGLGGYILAGTTAGLHLLLRSVDAFTALDLSVSSASGSLLRGVELEHLALHTQALDLEAGQTDLQLDVMMLLFGRVEVNRLHMDRVDAAWRSTASGDGGAGGPPLPVAVDDLRLSRLSLKLPGGEYRFNGIETGLSMDGQTLDWDRLNLYAGNLAVHGAGRLQFGPPPAIRTALTWTLEQQDGLPALSGSLDLQGDTNELAVKARLDQPFAASAAITARELLDRLRWEGTLAFRNVNPAAIADRFPALSAGASLHGSGDLSSLDLQGRLILSAIDIPGMTIEGATDNGELPLQLTLSASRAADGYRARAGLAWQDGGMDIRKGGLHLRLSSGQANLALAPGNNIDVSADSRFALNDRPGEIRLGAGGNADSLNLDRLRIHLQEGGSIEARAGYRRATGKLQLSADWYNLGLPVGGRQLHSREGQLALSGTLDEYRLDASARFDGKDFPAASLRLQAAGDRSGLALQPLAVETLDGRVTATGRLAWQPGASADLQVRGQGLDPARYWPAWPGKLEGGGRIHAQQSGDHYTINLEQWNVEGRLHGHPVTLQLDSVIAPGAITLQRAALASGSASLGLEGRVAGDRYALQWHIEAPDLAALLPDSGGRIRGQGAFNGTAARPVLQASLRGEDINSPWLSAGQVALNADIDLQKDNDVDLELDAGKLAYAGLSLERVQLQVQGTGARHDYRLTAAAGGGELLLAGRGSYTDRQWQGRTTQLRLQGDKLGTWSLEQPVTSRAGRGGLATDSLCLVRTGASICAGGTWRNAAHWESQLALHGVPLALGKPWFPYFLDVDGSLDASLDAARAGSDLRARGSLSLAPGTVTFQTDVDEYRHFRYDTGKLDLTFDDGKLDSSLLLHFQDLPAPLQAELHLQGLANPLAPEYAAVSLRASASGRVDDLGFVSSITPYVTDASGALDLNLNAAGTLAEPALSGTLHLADAGFYVPDLGIQLKDMDIRGSTTANGRYEFSGQWHSGKGITRVNASLQTTRDGLPVLHATLTGADAEIINLPEVWATATPDLSLALAPGHNTVKGDVAVPSGQINLDEIRPSTPVSGDVVLVGRPQKPAGNKLPPVSTDVNISLGDNVKIKGQGITGKLQGQLAIHSGSKKDQLLATGEIQIADGKYSAYGQSLQIEEGRLIYQQSPLDNPEIRVRAVKQVEDKTVGVRVTGFLSNPAVNLVSTPSMNQEQILSYLVFGRPLESLSSGEGADLVGAATTLGLQNSGFITSSLANTFGLDEFKVKTSRQAGQTNASLIIGKYLTPKLYLSYGIGLFESLSTAKMRYDITRRWSVEASQGAETSADLLYKFEK